MFAAIFDLRSHLVDASEGFPAGLVAPAPEGTWDIAWSGSTFAVLARRSDAGTQVVVGTSLDPLAARQRDLARLLLLAGVIGGSASMLLGWWLAGRALRPVDALTQDAALFGALDLERRLPDPGTADELGRLAHTLNAMLDRLTDGLRRQTAFLIAASHDLRTPLTALRVDLELASRPETSEAELRSAVGAAHLDVIRLSDLAAALLDLASVRGNGQPLVRTVIPLDELVDGVVRQSAAVARSRDVTVSVAVDHRDVSVDRILLGQALANLLTNAITHGPEHGIVSVTGRIGAADGSHPAVLELAVIDDGPGIPPNIREGLFAPFQRGPTQSVTTGHGLGLAIAAAAVTAHQGTLALQSAAGGGTRAVIRLALDTSR
ncbi:MAG: HAMP domain-containing histidine kinase [Chloroflexi bacterium]|nr:HAMP domain-containing histidine kinase [Chloroflexota bacterium]